MRERKNLPRHGSALRNRRPQRSARQRRSQVRAVDHRCAPAAGVLAAGGAIGVRSSACGAGGAVRAACTGLLHGAALGAGCGGMARDCRLGRRGFARLGSTRAAGAVAVRTASGAFRLRGRSQYLDRAASPVAARLPARALACAASRRAACRIVLRRGWLLSQGFDLPSAAALSVASARSPSPPAGWLAQAAASRCARFPIGRARQRAGAPSCCRRSNRRWPRLSAVELGQEHRVHAAVDAGADRHRRRVARDVLRRI